MLTFNAQHRSDFITHLDSSENQAESRNCFQNHDFIFSISHSRFANLFYTFFRMLIGNFTLDIKLRSP